MKKDLIMTYQKIFLIFRILAHFLYFNMANLCLIKLWDVLQNTNWKKVLKILKNTREEVNFLVTFLDKYLVGFLIFVEISEMLKKNHLSSRPSTEEIRLLYSSL